MKTRLMPSIDPFADRIRHRAVRSLQLWAACGIMLLVSSVTLRAQTAALSANQTTLALDGGDIILTATANYAGQTPAALAWEITLPDGWSFVGAAGTHVPGVVPLPGAGGLLEFAYSSPPEGQASFTITVRYPAATRSPRQIAGRFLYRSPLKSVSVDALTFDPAPAPQALASRLSNVSIRTLLKAGQILIVGLTSQGGSTPTILRAVGPGLEAFGVKDVMPDPAIAVFEGAQRLAENDNWSGTAALVSAFASVGAFPLTATSKDAALARPITGGQTLQVQGAAAGSVLVEVYDAGGSAGARLVNVSTRNQVGGDAGPLIAGFTLSGERTANLLIRGIGPTLAAFGVTGALADPKIEIFSVGGTKVAENDNWPSDLAAKFATVGAFSLANGSRDSAIQVALAPGGYTVHLTPASGSPGEAMVEVYELPNE